MTGRASIACGLCALLLSACGAHSDTEQIRAVVRAFGHALAVGDVGRVCSLLTPEAKRQMLEQPAADVLGAHDCPAFVAAARRMFDDTDLADFERVDVVDVKITGDRATVTLNVGDTDHTSHRTRLRKVDGKWLAEL
jgi:ketosteroid isomerase-like protein